MKIIQCFSQSRKIKDAYTFVRFEKSWKSDLEFLRLESIHYNLVRKIRKHFGGQFLHQTNLRKSAGHTQQTQQGSSLTLHKSRVTRSEDFLKFV